MAMDPRTRFETSGADLDEAERMYAETYEGTGFRGEETGQPVRYRFRATTASPMTLVSTTFGARMVGEVEPRGEYLVTWVSEGQARIDVGRDEVRLRPGVPAMFPTGRPFAFDFADVNQNVLQFERGYLERIAAELHGEEPGPLDFDHAVQPTTEALRRWNAQVREAAALVLGPHPPSELAVAETARATATTLLQTFRHRITVDPVTLPQGATGRVRQAIEYMHGSAHLPITSTDVAEHVGLSVRGLQQAFQRQVGSAPNTVLRGIRLDRVRDELMRAEPDQTTVATIAQRWGFAHLGRFSGAYAKRFGEYPRDTLHA